jgi:hypothetical protein
MRPGILTGHEAWDPHPPPLAGGGRGGASAAEGADAGAENGPAPREPPRGMIHPPISYLTKCFFKVAWQQSIPTEIRQLFKF